MGILTLFGIDVCAEIASLLDELFAWLRTEIGNLLNIEL